MRHFYATINLLVTGVFRIRLSRLATLGMDKKYRNEGKKELKNWI